MAIAELAVCRASLNKSSIRIYSNIASFLLCIYLLAKKDNLEGTEINGTREVARKPRHNGLHWRELNSKGVILGFPQNVDRPHRAPVLPNRVVGMTIVSSLGVKAIARCEELPNFLELT